MFRDPERGALWNVGWTDTDQTPTVSIEYQVRRRQVAGDGTGVAVKTLKLHELEDFQSSLILVQTSISDLREILMVEEFIQQYHIAQRALQVWVQLRDAGHFNYQHAVCQSQYALSTSTIELQADLRAAETELAGWESDLDMYKQQYFFLNTITLIQLWSLVKQADAAAASVQSDFHEATINPTDALSQTMALVLPACSHSVLQAALERGPWAPADEGTLTSGARLDRCGSWLDGLLSNIPLRKRQTAPHPVPQGSTTVHSGVSLIVCKSPFLCVLSLFAVAGWFPEREEVVLCTSETTWESISNFFQRWELADRAERCDRIFVILGLSQLSFAVQSRAAKRVRSAMRHLGGQGKQMAPLVVVADSEAGHIVSELSPFRIGFVPLPLADLQRFLAPLASSSGSRITVVSSPYAGAGKTFWARTEATARRHQIVKVPIHSETCTSELVNRLQSGFDAAQSSKDVFRTASGQASEAAFRQRAVASAPRSSGTSPNRGAWHTAALSSRRERTVVEEVPRPFAAENQMLIGMGFANHSLNERLLESHGGDIDTVITELIDFVQDEPSALDSSGPALHLSTDENHENLSSFFFEKEPGLDFDAADPATEAPLTFAPTDGITCHLSITRRTGRITQSALFELFMFGSLADARSGKHFAWNQAQTQWIVEVASDVDLSEMEFLAALPQHEVLVHPRMFCASALDLFAGMGAQFQSARHDGSTATAAGHGTTAYDRLQCVAGVLMRQGQRDRGKREADDTLNAQDIDGADAVMLLADASEQDRQSASLTSIWVRGLLARLPPSPLL